MCCDYYDAVVVQRCYEKRKRLETDCTAENMRTGELCWFGLMESKDDRD